MLWVCVGRPESLRPSTEGPAVRADGSAADARRPLPPVVFFSEKESPPHSDNTLFLLNNHTFDPNYVPITMKLGSVEQWTLVNTNTE